MSGSSKGVTVKELASFFSCFQVWESYVDMTIQIPIFRWSWQWLRLKNSNGIKETRLQTPISLSGLSINLQAWNHCPGHEENYMNYIYGAICFF